MLTIRNVTFLTSDPARLADFWAAALGLTERRDDEGETLLANAGWTFPRYTFQRVAAEPGDAGRLHLDLTADDRVAEVRRLVALGATEVRTHVEEHLSWTVLLDPDGNALCVSQVDERRPARPRPGGDQPRGGRRGAVDPG